jgi:hypothetical protein
VKLPERLEKAIDTIGLLIALAVDLIVIPICMITIAPDFLTKVAFVCIGITIVLFVFRSWAKGQKLAWLVFASVVFFFDFSFAIVATQAQSQKVDITQDAELKRIDGEILVSQSQITKLQDERTISTRPETIASISSDIQTENRKIDGLAIDRKAREKELSKTGGVYITADSVFTSIPDAWSRKRYIPLAVFGLIFLGLQMVVVTSIDSPNKKAKELANPLEKEKPAKQYQRLKTITLEIWIDLMWIGEKREPKDLRIPPAEIVKKWCMDKGYRFDEAEHAERIEHAMALKLISDTGRLISSKATAIDAMTGQQSLF